MRVSPQKQQTPPSFSRAKLFWRFAQSFLRLGEFMIALDFGAGYFRNPAYAVVDIYDIVGRKGF